MNDAALHAAILTAHDRREGTTLSLLYTQAADRAEAANDTDAACFFLTQAWVFALETGIVSAETLHRRLVARGREIPLRHPATDLGIMSQCANMS